MEVILARLNGVEAHLSKVDGRFDKIDDRLRSLEIDVGKISGKLDLLVGKIPSWWQPPVGLVAVLGAIAALIGILHYLGWVHS